MIAEFLGYLRDIWLSIVDLFMILVYAHVAPDWHFILKFLLICAFFLGSAFLTATIAETRRHKMKFHFLLGLVAPYIYPVVLALRLKVAQEIIDAEAEIDPLAGLSNSVTARFNEIKQEQEDKKKERIHRMKPEAAEEKSAPEQSAEAEAPAEPQTAAEPEVPAEPEAAVEAPVFSQRYFQGLAVDSSGAKVGPFRLITGKGMEFKVIMINNIQKDMASFEVEVKGSVKNIRLRYDNIETFEKI
jgi:hypothetical protein